METEAPKILELLIYSHFYGGMGKVQIIVFSMGDLQVIRFVSGLLPAKHFIEVAIIYTQRIEAWWSQLRRSFTEWWLEFFRVSVTASICPSVIVMCIGSERQWNLG